MIGIDVRFLRVNEWQDIEQIEQDCEWPIESFDEFKSIFYSQDCICLAGVYDEQIIAYAVMEVTESAISIARVAVDSPFRRMGVGTQMMNYITGMLIPGASQKIVIDISENNLGGQIFLRSMGFLAVRIVHDYLNSGEDAYIFTYAADSILNQRRFTLPAEGIE